MRTTVEIPDELRLRLIEESARIGERGYSGVVARALNEYFSQHSGSSGIDDRVDALFGSQGDADAHSGVTRSAWRTGRT
ncbi:MAG: hypothetical protein PF508_03270 [Spirochaeta sp.]|jgi:hypothetical protein|nr:hypothetical protein [Spirochaeta sp.]